jgi:hypothetical protein
MAMSVQIDEATGSGPTWAAVTAVVWNRADSAAGTSAEVPTPLTTGTNFSFVKTFQVEITATGSLSMTALAVGRLAAETTTGTKLWAVTSHTSYTQATAAPSATTDNNATAPSINGATAAAPALISAPPSAYSAGPYSTTGRVGNLVEVCRGVDATNTSAGSAVATPTLRWTWTEG